MRLLHTLAMLAMVPFGAASCTSSSSDETSNVSTVQNEVPDDGAPFLRVSKTSPTKVSVGLVAGSEHPRIADVRLKASNARFISAAPSAAITQAGKDLRAQPTSDGARFVIFSSSNVNTIGSGELFEAVFEPTGDGPMTIEILTDDPILAPAEAAEGLIVGDPITL